jgi:hypothetical protein
LDDSKGGGKYEFQNIDFNLDIGTPDSPNPEAYSMPGAPPWGTDYIWVDGDPKDLGKVLINGIDIFSTPWTVVEDPFDPTNDVLFGGATNLADNFAIFEATGGGTLTFDTLYDIEETWDYGFVQVSTDGGNNWTSLANASTRSDTDPSAHPTIVANVPGFTGSNVGWTTESFDLSAYAGQDILIAFRYVTDWFTLRPGWFVDNVYVDGELISDGSDTSVFYDITDFFPADNHFTITFVGFREVKGKGKDAQFKVMTIELGGEKDSNYFELNKLLSNSDKAVMMVTFDAPEGFNRYADYTYEFGYFNGGSKK